MKMQESKSYGTTLGTSSSVPSLRFRGDGNGHGHVGPGDGHLCVIPHRQDFPIFNYHSPVLDLLGLAMMAACSVSSVAPASTIAIPST